MTYLYGLHFSQPWWLAAGLLVVPVVWLGRGSLTALGRGRRWAAVLLRCVVVLVLVMLLARPVLTRKSKILTVVVVFDRSLSVRPELQQAALEYLRTALQEGSGQRLVAVVDVAEAASIFKLPGLDTAIRQRSTALRGSESRLADGVQMAMAIAPPDSAVRILLVTDGNQTAGDLKEAARRAAANHIPIDVLPLRYRHEREVIFKRLAAPARARSRQTISLRFVLQSTGPARGRLLLTANGEPVALAPGSREPTLQVQLEAGMNVRTVSLPVGSRGVHEFEAVFVPDGPEDDTISENNRATAITYVSGPGHVLVVDADGSNGVPVIEALQSSGIDVRYRLVSEFPDDLAKLMDTDAIVLINTDCSHLTYQQQEMLTRYVNDLGGGLVMVGGTEAFGAGGWIGSPVAEILPVELDPPQKKQLPKGALILIMHACEMPQGNFWGKRVALAAVRTLSRYDLVGVLAYNWQGRGDWVFPLSVVGDKKAVTDSIRNMQMGDMPSLHAHLQQAYDALTASDAVQKHVIIISDGDPQPPSVQLLNRCKQAGITCTGVGIFPHSPADVQSLQRVAQATGGRFYYVTDPQRLPQIFIKEAQVVRRPLLIEQHVVPQLVYGLSEIVRGFGSTFPSLEGYVLTGPKTGLNQTVLASPEGDPLLASCQAGLGRCVVFTSSVDSRWAAEWLGWGGFNRFWEQVVRWVGKSREDVGCEIYAERQGQNVVVTAEALDSEGRFISLAGVDGWVTGPDMSSRPVELVQNGPGQYQGQFRIDAPGSYVVTLRYRKPGAAGRPTVITTAVTVPFASEFQDLSDNAPLLAEVSEITGGRILPADPNQVNLFDYAGVKIPEARLPLIQPLMIAFLVLFLLDVAVRRVVVDFAAAMGWLGRLVRGRRARAEAVQSLERLRARRQELRQQWLRSADGYRADARYQAGSYTARELPLTQEPAPEEVKKAESSQAPPQQPRPEAEQSHIQRLLQAKKKAIDKRQDDGSDKQ